ncbi:MAG: phytanoyl-CoA dioxygenase [Aestuariivita sp.]|nr:phytanoyl-CoA dioxygenase [Aestuariivita sp.]
MPHLVTPKMVLNYEQDGVVLIKGLFSNYINTLRRGVEFNMQNPGPFGAENVKKGGLGRFFDDYCNWNRIDEFREVIEKSDAALVAAQLMKSETVQLFHDHVLVKEPGTSKATPWHSDSPYYFVKGRQNISFWAPLDPVREASLRLVAGSHKWPKQVLPTRWVSEENFYPDSGNYMPAPDPDKEGMPVLEFEMEPGDAVAFHYRCLHGARGNHSKLRRRVFSLRLLGDDARFTKRPGLTSPPFEGHEMKEGDRLRKDWFPILLDNTTH